MTVGDFVTLMARSRSGSWTTCWSSSRTRTSPTFPRSSQRSGLTSETSWAQDFARTNRDEMMDRVMTELSYLWFKANGHQAEIEQERINCHHNFTQLGSHFGRHVWLTRKGAIQMRKGAARGDSGLDGNTERHRRRAGESDGVSLGSPRRRTTLLALRGTAAVHQGRHGKGDAGDRVSPLETSSSTSFSVPTRTSTR
jgi:hypothetical protein